MTSFWMRLVAVAVLYMLFDAFVFWSFGSLVDAFFVMVFVFVKVVLVFLVGLFDVLLRKVTRFFERRPRVLLLCDGIVCFGLYVLVVFLLMGIAPKVSYHSLPSRDPYAPMCDTGMRVSFSGIDRTSRTRIEPYIQKDFFIYGNSPCLLVDQAWLELEQQDWHDALAVTQNIQERYQAVSRINRDELEDPAQFFKGPKGQLYNAVAVAFYIQGDVWLRLQNPEKAAQALTKVIRDYPDSMGYDYQHQRFVSVAAAAQKLMQEVELIK